MYKEGAMKKILITLLLVVATYSIAWTAEVKTFTATVNEKGIQSVEIKGGDYYFEPNNIIVKVNVPVELTVKKAPGYIPHDIVMNAPEAGMSFKVDFNKEGSIVKFTPTKTGKFPFFCDKKLLFFESHRKKGMEGTIEVVE